ncbi:MAG TPA: Rieske (2Fe-2S) protein [Mycobacteriales bacterium]|jgi:nitrite reductase/ring-hydroxylating ferredoxin subunit|nr:Rieske (2Fe-2S) protein [Mycobacteriales bacterium]
MTTPGTGLPRAALPRREMLCGALLLGGVAVGALAGCGAVAGPGASGDGSPSGGGSGSVDAGAPGTVLAKVADVPVGGGTLVTAPDGAAVIVVQPQAGTIRAYSATCPHRGARVQAPDGGIMTCPSHGSEFRIRDGSVLQGPATRGLLEIAVTVAGQEVTLG